VRALPRERAWTIGQRSSHGRTPHFGRRSEHVAAELADGGRGVDAEQRRRLRIEIAHAAVLVDAEHAFGDAGEHRRAFRLLPTEVGGCRRSRARMVSSSSASAPSSAPASRSTGVARSPAPIRAAAPVRRATGSARRRPSTSPQAAARSRSRAPGP
jgi:hypothetical protein